MLQCVDPEDKEYPLLTPMLPLRRNIGPLCWVAVTLELRYSSHSASGYQTPKYDQNAKSLNILRNGNQSTLSPTPIVTGEGVTVLS